MWLRSIVLVTMILCTVGFSPPAEANDAGPIGFLRSSPGRLVVTQSALPECVDLPPEAMDLEAHTAFKKHLDALPVGATVTCENADARGDAGACRIYRMTRCKCVAGCTATPLPGKIVVADDEWILSNYGFEHAPDAGQFALSVAAWFTDGRPGRFLVFSESFGLTEAALANTMTNAGHTWTVSTAAPFSLARLQQYDGVFLAQSAADNQVLIDYVRAGGNVYVAGGTGFGDAALWNTFLHTFGLEFSAAQNGLRAVVPIISSSHPIFSGVASLYQDNGNTVIELDPPSPKTETFLQGLFAVFSG